MEASVVAPMAHAVVAFPLLDLLTNGLLTACCLLLHDVGVTSHPRNNLVIGTPSHQCGRPHRACVALIWIIGNLGRNQGGRSSLTPLSTLLISASRNILRSGLLRRLSSDEPSNTSRNMITSYVISTTNS